MGQLNTITDFITQLLTQHIGQFAFLGQGMFLSFATIMIVWFGAKAALSSADRGGGFQFGNFAGLVMMIAFGFAMTQYYAAPIPGIRTQLLSPHHRPDLLPQRSDCWHAAAERRRRYQQVSGADSVTGLDRFIRQHRLHRGSCDPGTLGSRSHYRHRLWLRCTGDLHFGRPCLHPLLHRSQARMALLGMAQMLHAVRLLPGHRCRNHVRDGKSCHQRSHPASVSTSTRSSQLC